MLKLQFKRLTRKQYVYALIAGLLLASMVAFYYFSHQRAPNIRKSKELVVLTHNAAGTYYVDGKGNYAGLEYDLANLFAQELGEDYRLRFIVADKVSDVIPLLQKGKAHLAAANLSITAERSNRFVLARPTWMYNST